MAKSSQKMLVTRRKPRVHIMTEVETGFGQEKKELPFVVGVMGDFSGDPTKKLEPLSKRKFVQVDRDNFNEVFKQLNVGLEISVPNLMTEEEGKELRVGLKFESMDDFEPAAIARQIEPLKNLLNTREQLKNLAAKVGRSEDLEDLLEEVLKDHDKLKKLSAELGE
ncbi:MAG: type VI secretion system contractile sheath small subunit [Pirellulaceae bacterium]|nr:type VI secretion system contractile sheath small subunit [Pirellulaceae bacterium]